MSRHTSFRTRRRSWNTRLFPYPHAFHIKTFIGLGSAAAIISIFLLDSPFCFLSDVKKGANYIRFPLHLCPTFSSSNCISFLSLHCSFFSRASLFYFLLLALSAPSTGLLATFASASRSISKPPSSSPFKISLPSLMSPTPSLSLSPISSCFPYFHQAYLYSSLFCYLQLWLL